MLQKLTAISYVLGDKRGLTGILSGICYSNQYGSIAENLSLMTMMFNMSLGRDSIYLFYLAQASVSPIQ